MQQRERKGWTEEDGQGANDSMDGWQEQMRSSKWHGGGGAKGKVSKYYFAFFLNTSH